MSQDYFGSIDTDRGIAEILSRFDSQFIVDVINDSLRMRFRPFNTPSPNYVEVLERQFKEVAYASPDYREKVDQCRADTYKEIIAIICNFYGLSYSEEINSINTDELHGIAYMMYDIFISRFTDHMIDFYTSYIVKNADQFISMLESDPDAIQIKDNTMYQSKQFSDPKWIFIHQNTNRIVYNMAGFDISFNDLLLYFLGEQLNWYERLCGLFSDNGDIYKNHYAIYVLNGQTSAAVYTQIKLNLQAKTQQQVYIGEF